VNQLLVEHPDFAKYVAMTQNKALRGGANSAARALLGLPIDAPVKTGPRGKQRFTEHGRSIETVAHFLKNQPIAGQVRPTRLSVTLKGPDSSGPIVVASDHPLYADLVAMVENA
jgi:hypothetical protein